MATILLVEDAADLAQVIARELEAAGHTIWVAGDGPAALVLQVEQAPDWSFWTGCCPAWTVWR
jgi:CheY-like chemotaxis protein